MIKQSIGDSDSILLKKFKLLRTSIMLGNYRNRESIMKEYEETAREIDKINKNVYEELLASKMYTTTSLEEEQTRLKELIDFIEKRIKERNDFIDDYIKITSNFLDGLDKVSLEDELPDYKNRVGNIDEYLSNVARIKEIDDELKKLRDELKEKYDNKANNEIINSKLEEELIEEFNKIIARDEYYSGLNYTDIDEEIGKIDLLLKDKKEVMDTFTSSYQALASVGISGAEREEYLSYVQDSRLDYYQEKEKKYILEIYKAVLDKKSDYDKLYEKRLYIDGIINDREECRRELEINSRDMIEYFVDLCREQFSIIKSQKFNIESIDKIILEIANKEEELEKLEHANQRDEIVSLLEEFSVDNYVAPKIEMPKEREVVIENDSIDNTPKPANMVIKVTEPVNINVKNAADTAKLVMKKVVIVLEPKKFNGKKNKLKEAEKELEEAKKKELENKELEKEKAIKDTDVSLDSDNLFSDNSLNIDNSNEEIVIPTEIKIEEPKEETINLFKETDPFLDDNQFEINSGNEIDDNLGIDMPVIKNIGTVKPNNVLSKIENVTNENDDIILPTMGLSNSEKEGVPIVSENYIN